MFDEADLEANRSGYISDVQKALLRAQIPRNVLASGETKIALFIVILISTVVLMDLPRQSIYLWLIMFVMVANFIRVQFPKWWQTARDLKSGTVERITGTISLSIVEGRSLDNGLYTVSIQDKSFPISKDVLLSLRERKHGAYRIVSWRGNEEQHTNKE